MFSQTDGEREQEVKRGTAEHKNREHETRQMYIIHDYHHAHPFFASQDMQHDST